MTNIFLFENNGNQIIIPEASWVRIKYVIALSEQFYGEETYEKAMQKPNILEYIANKDTHSALANKYPEYNILLPPLPSIPSCHPNPKSAESKTETKEPLFEHSPLTEQIIDEFEKLGIKIGSKKAIEVYPSGRSHNGWVAIRLEDVSLTDTFKESVCNEECPKGVRFKLTPKRNYYLSKRDQSFFKCFNLMYTSEEELPETEMISFRKKLRRVIKDTEIAIIKIIKDAIAFTET